MPKFTKITVLIVDDHHIVREGLTSLLNAADDVEVAGVAENGEEAVRKAKRLRPNVILLDIAMPVMHGIETAHRLSAAVPESKILILSSYSDSTEVARAMEAGASGYLMKETASAEILIALREIHKGNSYFSPAIVKRIAQQTPTMLGRNVHRRIVAPRLSARESQVLELITLGKPNKQIADDLQISIKTVEKHRASLMTKLNIHEAASLTRYAVSAGLVPTHRPSIAASV